jgi:hypothetical protein
VLDRELTETILSRPLERIGATRSIRTAREWLLLYVSRWKSAHPRFQLQMSTYVTHFDVVELRMRKCTHRYVMNAWQEKVKQKRLFLFIRGPRSFMLAGTAALFWIRWISLRCHITSLSQNRRWNIIGITKAFLTVADHQSAHIDWSTKKSTLRDIPQSGWKLDKNPCHYYLTAAVTTESNCDQYQTLYAYMSRHFQCARIN